MPGATLESNATIRAPRAGPLNRVNVFLRKIPFIIYLTLFAAIIRFIHLDTPSLWGDESKVFMRVCGTFQQLVDALAGTDFSPLHYLLYWAMAQCVKLTPAVMRVPPAIAGTIMVPAVYWLAIQIVSRPAARVAAIFTACSAFMLNYSHDAKMYGECWLFVTLSTASLLWFIRTRSRNAWYLWIIFSIAMVGLQVVAALVLPIQLIALLCHRNLHWKSAVFFVAGIAVIVAPLVAYVKYFNRYADRLETGRVSDGTQWVEPYNRGRDGSDLLRYTATAFAYNWEWPKASDEQYIAPKVLHYLKWTGCILLPLAIFGIYPWRRREANEIAEAWWRNLLWMGAWIVLPTYGFYCASMYDRQSPTELLRQILHNPIPTLGCIFAAGVVVYRCDENARNRLKKAALFSAITAILLILASIIHRFTPVQQGSVWMPRYLGIIFPAFVIGLAVLVMRLPFAILRYVAIAFFCAVNLVQHGARLVAESEPPTALMAADTIRGRPTDSTTRLYNRVPASPIGEPGAGVISTYPYRYYLAIQSNKPITPADMRTTAWESDFRVFNLFRTFASDITISQNLRGSPQLNQIIVWDRIELGQPVSEDTLAPRLPMGWYIDSETTFHARDHWTWKDLYLLRRRVYVKK